MMKLYFKLLILMSVYRTSLTFKDDDTYDTDDDKINSYTEGNFLVDLTADFIESKNEYFSSSYKIAKAEIKSFCDQWASTVGDAEVPDTKNKNATWIKAGGITSWIDSDFSPTEIQQMYTYENAPHIVFVLVDDWGYNDIGYRSTYLNWTTPTIDKLAAEGIKLENYYNHYSCAPSRSALLTSKYAFVTGMQDDRSGAELPLKEITLAQELKSAGYHTYMVGKWHLGISTVYHHPMNRGFDSFYGYFSGFVDYWDKTYHGYLDLSDGFDIVTDESELDETLHNGYLLQTKAEKAIDDYISNYGDSDEPMFLYYSMQLMHGVWAAPDTFLQRCDDTKLLGVFDDDYDNTLIQTYCAMNVMLDEAIANLTCKINSVGMGDNTILVIISDNGGEGSIKGNNYPMRASKGSYFNGGVLGNGIIHSKLVPESVRGTSYYGQVHITDWLPTLMGQATNGEWTGSYSGDTLDGVDVWSAILENSTSPHQTIVHYHDGENCTLQYKMVKMISVTDWKDYHVPDHYFAKDQAPQNSVESCSNPSLVLDEEPSFKPTKKPHSPTYFPTNPTYKPTKKPFYPPTGFPTSTPSVSIFSEAPSVNNDDANDVDDIINRNDGDDLAGYGLDDDNHNDDGDKNDDDDDNGGDIDDIINRNDGDDLAGYGLDDDDADDDLIPTLSPTPLALNPSVTHNPTPTDLAPTSKTQAPTQRGTLSPTDGVSDNFDDDDDDGDDDDDDDDDDDFPVLAPTELPTISADIEDANTDDTTSFTIGSLDNTNVLEIVALVLVLITISCGIFYHCNRKKVTESQLNDRINDLNPKNSKFFSSYGSNAINATDYSEESALLQSQENIGDNTGYINSQNNFSAIASAVTSLSNPASTPRIYFRASDLEGIDLYAALMSRFTAIISAGVACKLYTTKGPKPILLSMVGYEVRWQAVKSAQKRYKLHLKDIVSVEIGKQTSNFMKSTSATDNLCFSLVTQKTTLDLEADSKIERDSLVKGFQLTIVNFRSPKV